MSEEGTDDSGQQTSVVGGESATAEGAEQPVEQTPRDTAELTRKVDAAAWALFFIWTGIAVWTNLGLGGAMLGVGLIMIAALAMRKYLGLKMEAVWLVVGVLFIVGGLWGMLDMKVPLGPILLIVAGVAILIAALGGKSPLRK
jgi:hypothetical protein